VLIVCVASLVGVSFAWFNSVPYGSRYGSNTEDYDDYTPSECFVQKVLFLLRNYSGDFPSGGDYPSGESTFFTHKNWLRTTYHEDIQEVGQHVGFSEETIHKILGEVRHHYREFKPTFFKELVHKIFEYKIHSLVLLKNTVFGDLPVSDQQKFGYFITGVQSRLRTHLHDFVAKFPQYQYNQYN